MEFSVIWVRATSRASIFMWLVWVLPRKSKVVSFSPFPWGCLKCYHHLQSGSILPSGPSVCAQTNRSFFLPVLVQRTTQSKVAVGTSWSRDGLLFFSRLPLVIWMRALKLITKVTQKLEPWEVLRLESCTQDWNPCPHERTAESCCQSLPVVMWWDSTHPWEDAGTRIHPGRQGSRPSWDTGSASALILFFSASRIMRSKALFISYLVQGILCGSRNGWVSMAIRGW